MMLYGLLGQNIKHSRIFLHLDLFTEERVIYQFKLNIRLFGLLKNVILVMIYPTLQLNELEEWRLNAYENFIANYGMIDILIS